MMNSYTKFEFYADLLDHKMDKARKRISDWLYYAGVAAFLGLVIYVFLQMAKQGEAADPFSSSADDQTTGMQWIDYLAWPGFILLVMPFIPTVLHIVRKYWLYPKSSLTQKAFVGVKSKEIIEHPRTRTSNGHPLSHIVVIAHPADARLIPVDLSEEWFDQLKEGDRIHVNYHPAQWDIIYLSW